LIFDAAALPGGWGDRLLLTIGVPSSVPPNKQLLSTVTIEAPSDANPGNNGPFSQEAWTTSSDRPDLRIDKGWDYGQLIQSGHAFYHLNYSNDGNLTQQNVRLSDILPAGTAFVTSTVDVNWGDSYGVTPITQEAGKITWDLGTLKPGQWGNLKVELALTDTPAGTTITNTADIRGLNRDRTWGNNHSTAVERINTAGPNLRLHAQSSWESPETVRFQLNFENVGTTAVDDVRVTDTLPPGLEFNGDWWPNWWRDLDMTYNPATREITWRTSRLEPNWAGTIFFHAQVAQPDAGKQGLVFGNTAQITVPNGEVTAVDNQATAVAFTGPDLYVEKALWDGKVAAGEVVTFTVTLGNRNNGPWGTGTPPQGSPAVYLKDTLPEGVIFLQATSGPQVWTPWKQEGNVVTWTIDNVCAGCWWQMLVEARIGDTVKGGTTLTNTMEITDAVPGDVDPFPANNRATWQGKTESNRVYLPLLRR
jgi:uncharacterized repeat protein (TIGR01451 family)